MYSLAFLLSRQDTTFRRLVAEAWQLPDPEALARDPEALARALTEQELAPVWNRLPREARHALQELLRSGGALPWEPFVRAYGPLRLMGPMRMVQERPHEHPDSPLEALWYRALVGRGLRRTQAGIEEVAYVPLEWQERLRGLFSQEEMTSQEAAPTIPGRPAVAEEVVHPQPAGPFFIFDLVTLLAGWRQRRTWEEIQPFLFYEYPPQWMQRFLEAWGLITPEGLRLDRLADVFRLPASRLWLQAWQTWLEADFHDILAMEAWEALEPLPDDPRRPRQWLLATLQQLPEKTWWSWIAFLEDVARKAPDFARDRPGHRSYWRFQQGAKIYASERHWPAVDGALLRFLVYGPMRWFGLVETAGQAFRLSPYARALLRGEPPPLPPFRKTVFVRGDGHIVVPARVLPVVRYQIARATAWEARRKEAFIYRLDPTRLAQAQAQGLSIERLLYVLRKYSPGVPRPVLLALQRWARGEVARFHTWRVLQLPSPEALTHLRQSRYREALLQVLSEDLVVIRPDMEAHLRRALWEMGYFIEGSQENH